MIEHTAVDGAEPGFIHDAIDRSDPLPGSGGFAGRIEHGKRGPVLARDVLGRRPLFSERDSIDPTAKPAYAFSPTELDEPIAVPAGVLRSIDGDIQHWTLPQLPAHSEPVAMDRITDAVGESISAVAERDLAVAFSGGVDSALVASAVQDAPCYVVGFEGSHDVEKAKQAADSMGRSLTVVEITHDDLIRAIPRIATAINRTNPMDIAIALPLYLVAKKAHSDGYNRLALGQGADELFGGYSKHVSPADDHRVNADTVRGAIRESIGTLPAQLERDVLTLRSVGVEPVTPYLHDRVIVAALGLPASLLATPSERKIALRRIAADHLPEPVYTADKKAVQYGTYVSRELDRLARQAGFKRRMDDHVGQYIRSLL